jgi:hypothetical protein
MAENNVKVQTTRDYDSFKHLLGNRDVDDTHVMRLVKATKGNRNLLSLLPILTNEKREVIDGQHRLEALRELNEPVSFIEVPGVTLADTLEMNTTQKNWTPRDFAVSYASQGLEPYKIYLELADAYQVGHSTLLRYIRLGRGVNSSAATTNSERASDHFRRGLLNIPNIANTRAALDSLIELGEKRGEQNTLEPELVRDRAFAAAYLRVYLNPSYNQERMIEKIDQWGKVFPKLRDVTEILRQLEEIYNFRIQDENKTRLY